MAGHANKFLKIKTKEFKENNSYKLRKPTTW